MLFTCNTSNNLNDLFLTKTTNCFLSLVLVNTNRSDNLFSVKCYNNLFTNERKSIRFDINYIHKLLTLNIIEIKKNDELRREKNRYLSTIAILLITRLLTTIEYR